MTPARPPSHADFDPAFSVDEPDAHTMPFVFNTPHSGAVYPDWFLTASRLDGLALRRSEDAFVDRLFAPVVELGAPLLKVNFPRAYLDVNREPYELDPRMFVGRVPASANTRSLRVAGGLGTVPRVVADGQEIYRERLPIEDALQRIEDLYKPYHRALRGLILRTVRSFGHAVLIDCHSMPSTSVASDGGGKADIVLGDRFGTACTKILTELFEQHCKAVGLRTARNKPYAGGFITEHYGEPRLGRHALQIEINRALYMNEQSLALTDGFAGLMTTLRHLVAEVAADWNEATAARLAAE